MEGTIFSDREDQFVPVQDLTNSLSQYTGDERQGIRGMDTKVAELC
jgi:hypothetical protein